MCATLLYASKRRGRWLRLGLWGGRGVLLRLKPPALCPGRTAAILAVDANACRQPHQLVKLVELVSATSRLWPS